LRLGRSRSRSSSILAVVGGCLAVYAVCAVGFHWLVEPTVKSQGVAPYEPSVATIVQPATSYVTPARSDVPSRVTSRPPASASMTAVAPKAVETARSEPPRVASPMTAAGPKATEPSRAEPPPPMIVTAAAPQSAETARAEPASRVAPAMTIAAPKSAETARAEATAPVASEAPAVAAPEATENVASAPKKPKKVARKTPRHERSRDQWNPLNFFAWGGNNGGWRRSF
jgi:hypothetical protein